LIGTIIAVSGIWWYLETQSGAKDSVADKTTTTKVSTSSAKTETITEDKTDETANWETFTSSTCNFSLKYPKDWSYAGEDSNGVGLRNVDELGGDTPQLRISVYCNDKLTAYYNKIKDFEVGKTTEVIPAEGQVNDEVDKYTRLSDQTIDSNKALRFKINLGHEDVDVKDKYEVLISKNNEIYYFYILGGVSLDEKEKTLDQILSTLKFI